MRFHAAWAQTMGRVRAGAGGGLYAHDLPALALQHLGDGAVEHGAVGGGDLQAEGVVARGHDAAADLEGRRLGTRHAAPVAVFHGPGWHDAYS